MKTAKITVTLFGIPEAEGAGAEKIRDGIEEASNFLQDTDIHALHNRNQPLLGDDGGEIGVLSVSIVDE